MQFCVHHVVIRAISSFLVGRLNPPALLGVAIDLLSYFAKYVRDCDLDLFEVLWAIILPIVAKYLSLFRTCVLNISVQFFLGREKVPLRGQLDLPDPMGCENPGDVRVEVAFLGILRPATSAQKVVKKEFRVALREQLYKRRSAQVWGPLWRILFLGIIIVVYILVIID